MRKPRARTPSGAISRAGVGPDRGTTETQAQRRYLAGIGLDWPLGILRAYGDISQAQYDAACRYVWLRRHVIPDPKLATMRIDTESWAPRVRDEATEINLEAEYQAMVASLLGLGRRTLTDLHDIAIACQTPTWMGPRTPKPDDLAAVGRLLYGLTALAKIAGY